MHACLSNGGGMFRPETRIQMEAYAVIETGGKQYRVQQGDVVSVELIEGAEAGQSVEIGRVLAVNDGSGLKVGAPVVDGAKVMAEVVETLYNHEIDGKVVIDDELKAAIDAYYERYGAR